MKGTTSSTSTQTRTLAIRAEKRIVKLLEEELDEHWLRYWLQKTRSTTIAANVARLMKAFTAGPHKNTCAWCGAKARKRCVGCVDAPTHYCSRHCQKLHWREAHRYSCQRSRATRPQQNNGREDTLRVSI